jgi:hypothetical protein
MPSRARAPTLLYCEAIAEGAAETPALNLDAVGRRWARVVAPTVHTPPFDVVDSFLNVGAARLDFEAARRNELLGRVFAPAIWEQRERAARGVHETPRNVGVFGLWRPLSRSNSRRFGSFLDR